MCRTSGKFYEVSNNAITDKITTTVFRPSLVKDNAIDKIHSLHNIVISMVLLSSM